MTGKDSNIPPQPRKHLIKSAALRVPLKILYGLVGFLLLFLLLLPVLVYIPPVQTLLKDVACRVVGDATGMKVSVEHFRLRFPLDVELQGVKIIEASGDTMVSARSLVADLKVRPLLHGDIDLNKLELLQGSYRMLSADSSLRLSLRAGYLRTDPGSDFNLKDMHLKLRNPELRNAVVKVDMDVWKQKKDTASTPTKFLIEADNLTLYNVQYSMTMPPTIASLDVTIGQGKVKDALINLTDSKIKIGDVQISESEATYLTPTAEYVKAHPAPVDTTASSGPPMTVEIGRASLGFTRALYATEGAKPQPGFDPSYIEVQNLNLTAHDFYNCQATVRIPIDSLTATERSGLTIESASGLIAIDASGLTLNDFSLSTPATRLSANASLPFELMALQAGAPAGEVNMQGVIGWSDIFAFMPSLRSTVASFLPAKALSPLKLTLNGNGTLSKVQIERLALSTGNFLTLNASGFVTEPMHPSRMSGSLTFDGSMRDPSLTLQLLRRVANIGKEYRVPSFTIKGKAAFSPQVYKADAQLLTSAGNVAAKGEVAMRPEAYEAHAEFASLRLGEVMPSLGLGTLSGSIDATGAGFNPLLAKAHTEVDARFTELSYNGQTLAPLLLTASARQGQYTIDLDCQAPKANLTLNGTGELRGKGYFADLQADVVYLDLQALGLIDKPCHGSGRINLIGEANPTDMLFDLDLSMNNVDWEFADNIYSLRHPLDATFTADEAHTLLTVKGEELTLDLRSPSALPAIMASVNQAMPEIMKQVEAKQFDFEQLQSLLPQFTLKVDAAGSGLLAEFLEGTGVSLNSLTADLSNTDAIKGDIRVLGAGNDSFMADTLTLTLNQRGKMLNYRAHMGNTPANLPEFAQVNLSGYVGGNRGSIFINQRNAQGKQGYKLGLTAAMVDSTLALHFTPTNAIIAYKDWTVNEDNYVNLGPGRKVEADLTAGSGVSSIRLRSSMENDSLPALDVDIKNLYIQDFLQLSAMAPPVTGAVNSQMHLVYRGKAVTGKGNIGVKNLAYDNNRVGDLDFNFKAGMGFSGRVGASLGLLLNEKEVLMANGYFMPDSVAEGVERTKLRVRLKEFPLSVANPFLGPDVAQLYGHLNGDMTLTGLMTAPMLNGEIVCDSVGVYVPMAASRFRFSSTRTIDVKDNVLNFDDFYLYGANDNPIALNGIVDARNLKNLNFDLSLDGTNVALVNNKRSSGADIYGSLFVTLAAKAKGNMSRMTIDGNLSVLPATNIFYNLTTTSQASLTSGSTTDVVKFVQFADSTQVAAADSLASSGPAMRITASLNIVSGAMATVNISGTGSGKVQLSPSGALSFLQTYMGDRRLNGTLKLGTGSAQYSMQVIGEKKFQIDPESYVTWTGDLLNPALQISATDRVRANVQQEGSNSRLIYFNVGLNVTGTLSAPKVNFDLSTDEDITVQNELQGMSPEQRSASAINLLLYNTYTGPGVKASANLAGNPLYSLLESQLNSIAAKYITGVDLSFGIDQYDKTVNGETSGTTSYSYQVSKSLFDNRFKIVVGGNYSTDANADENFAQNLISDVSFEYSIKQTATSSMLVRLFRHTGFESILEGEVTETGVGFVLKRKLNNLRSLFRFGRRKKKDVEKDTVPADSQPPAPRWEKVELPSDSNTPYDHAY